VILGIGLVVLLGLFLTNFFVGRSLLYPPALFAAAWLSFLGLLALSGDRFRPISESTVLVFIVGAVALSAGGGLAMLVAGLPARERSFATRPQERIGQLLGIGGWLLAFSFPLRVLRARDLGGRSGPVDWTAAEFWLRVRSESLLEGEAQRTDLLSFSDNILLLAIFLALAAVASDVTEKRFRWRTAVIVLLALTYQLMMANRATALSLLVGLAVVAWLTRGRVTVRAALGSVAASLLVFSLIAVVLSKGGNVKYSLADNVVGVYRVFQLYLLGPIVAFDHTIRAPDDIAAVWSPDRSLLLVANKFGGSFDVPSLHAEYSEVSTGEFMNVYTMYFAYFPTWGWTGVVLFPFVVGALATWLFRLARDGDPRARLVCALALAGLVLSGFNEQFFMNLTFYVKAALFCVVLYGFPSIRLSSVAEEVP
jgi:oligosaccharide repeat unit polymerase